MLGNLKLYRKYQMGDVSRSRVCYLRAATSSLDFPQNIWMLSLRLVSFVFFSKHRPSGPMLSISRNVRPSVCPSVCPSVRLSVCSLLRYRLNVFLPQLLKVGCPKILEIRNPWGKVMKRSGLRFEHFCVEVV